MLKDLKPLELVALPSPSARPEIERLKAYSAPLEGRRDLLRLDFNENTMGPSPRVTEAIGAFPAVQVAILVYRDFQTIA